MLNCHAQVLRSPVIFPSRVLCSSDRGQELLALFVGHFGTPHCVTPLPLGCGSLPPGFHFQSTRLLYFLCFFLLSAAVAERSVLFVSSCSVSLSARSGTRAAALCGSQRYPQQCPALLKSNEAGKEGREQENPWPRVDSPAHCRISGCQWVLRDLCVQLEMLFLCICDGKTHLLTGRKLLIMGRCWSSLGKEVLLAVANSLCSCLMET